MKQKSSARRQRENESDDGDVDGDGDRNQNNVNNSADTTASSSEENEHSQDEPSSERVGQDSTSSGDDSFGSESSSIPQGRGGGGNSCRLVDNDFGKIRPVSSRDTVSTASVSQMDSSAWAMSHTSGPLQQHQRGSRRPSRHLYIRQLNILMSSTGASLVMFLFFFMNIFAFTALMSFVASITMLVYTSYAYIMHLVRSGELNIFSLLPEETRNRFLNTSIHEIMTDNSGYMENRFMLLYFIPGLTPEQILQMVNRLPQRHRDRVLGPGGIAQMLMPSANSIVRSTNSSETQNQPITHHYPLPVIEEEEHDGQGQEVEVTNRDALRSLFSTARTLVSGNSMDEQNENEEELYVHTHPQNQQYHDLSWDNVESREENEVQSQDSEDSDLGLEINADDLTGNMAEGRLNRIARIIGLQPSNNRAPPTTVAAPSNIRAPPTTVTAIATTIPPNDESAPLPFSASHDTEVSQLLEAERNLESEIMNDAVAAAMDNYYGIAMQTISSVTANVVESVAPIFIRGGIRLSSISGLGLFSIYSSRALSEYPVTLMGRSFTSRNLAEGRRGRVAVRGLASTLFLGIVTFGSAYITRLIMRIMRRQRQSLLEEKKNEKDKTKTSNDH
jgi:hypothetical protein